MEQDAKRTKQLTEILSVIIDDVSSSTSVPQRKFSADNYVMIQTNSSHCTSAIQVTVMANKTAKDRASHL